MRRRRVARQALQGGRGTRACPGGMRSQAGEELATEDASEHLDREEEGTARRDPAGVVRSEATGGDDAVDVRMMLQTLVPGMEHAEEADLRAQMSRIACDLQQRCGTGPEQQAVDHLLVLERKRSQFTRHRKDRMDVAGRQQLALTLLEPANTRVALAPRAMPVCDTSCRRWPCVRSRSTDRDGRREQPCGIARSRPAPSHAGR